MSALLGLALLCANASAADGVFVMGVDGLDPVILQRMVDEGQLPQFAKLIAEGDFQELGTSNPPQSPVAWSNFVTGMDPGGHGIFDFVHRDPATYLPVSSATPPHNPEDDPTVVEFFGYYLPLSSPPSGNNRGGTPWWDLLERAGVDVEVYRMPGNFPVPESAAKVLSGMGTVDMRGGYGTYTWWTDTPHERADIKGDLQLVTVRDDDLNGTSDTASGVLRGPPDVFHLAPGKVPSLGDYLTQRVTVNVDEEFETALVSVGDERVLLKEGEWSGWVPVSFDALPLGVMPIDGQVRFYAKELRPHLKLYASPVNLSPESPAMPITSPDDWSEQLFGALGRYYTQGMPEETDALKDRTFDDDDYLGQVALVQQDTRAMLDLALQRFEPGDTTFVYFSDVDLQCHMLWRHHDPKHPDAPVHPAMDNAEASAKHAHDIEGFYRSVDAALGEVRGRLPTGTTLIVMSDHGFQPFTRKVHLNSWLREQGYLVLKEGKTTGGIPQGDVDWSRTRAYGLGFNGLYLNLQGREAQGIVPQDQADALMKELSDKLLALRDTERGDAVVVRDMYRSSEIYHGDRVSEAPDLVVGYDKGYGASDASTLGEIVAEDIQDNTSRWSGNHLMSPEVVPGVVLSDHRIQPGPHRLEDLTVTLLAHYGVAPAAGMTGTSVFSNP